MNKQEREAPNFCVGLRIKMQIKAKTIKRLHIAALIVWMILVIPTVTIWADSVKWVNIMSIYAIIVGHLAGLGAARIERKEEKKDED